MICANDKKLHRDGTPEDDTSGSSDLRGLQR